MQAPQNIRQVWHSFDAFPMETITKAWVSKIEKARQRTVDEMRSHYKKTGATGNCFDLTIWLIDELQNHGIKCYAVGEHIGTESAHVATMAEDENGKRYLCDLGDQWIQPICIEEDINTPIYGYFPAAGITLQKKTGQHSGQLKITYHRPGDKQSQQNYDLQPVSQNDLIEAGHLSQNNIAQLLIEVRQGKAETVNHWEFYNWQSQLSSSKGLIKENACSNLNDWSERIAKNTGIKKAYAEECLSLFNN